MQVDEDEEEDGGESNDEGGESSEEERDDEEGEIKVDDRGFDKTDMDSGDRNHGEC